MPEIDKKTCPHCGHILELGVNTKSPSCGMLKTPTLAMRYEDIKSIWRVKVEASEILGISKPVFYVYIGVKSGGCHTQAFDTEEEAVAFFEEIYAKMQNCL